MNNHKKTIQINPDLFKIQGGSSRTRTRSNRERKTRIEKPITPNLLKKQLIERIRNHKKKIEQLENQSHKTSDKNIKIYETSISSNSDDKEDDEFIMSMNYLSSLSEKDFTSKNEDNVHQKEKPYSDVIVNLELEDNLKNDIAVISQSFAEPVSELELLPEISFDNYPTNNEQQNVELNIIDNNYTKVNIEPDVPYGCLKNGSKPTYRKWVTQKNNIYKNAANPSPSPNNNHFLDREDKLNQLKSKIKDQNQPYEEPLTYIKTTIRRKYTLGKSKVQRKIGVLIKNMNTRKKIVDSHKELKKHNIQDIKKYLYKRGLIKIGNNTPTDLLRKLYESSILTGDVNNINKDTLLHNLINEDVSGSHFT
jgi:hypothetical protein